MTWKSVFSRIALCAVLCMFLFAAVSVSAQQTRLRKSATGRVSSGTTTQQQQQQTRGNLSNDELQIHNLVNYERRKKSLGDLIWDSSLAGMARAFSRQMARESFFSHYDRNGKSVIDRARQSNITGWSKIGENLYFCSGYDRFDSLAVRSWMNSSQHRRNILDRQFTGTGIGVAQTRDGRTYITQVFIRN